MLQIEDGNLPVSLSKNSGLMISWIKYLCFSLTAILEATKVPPPLNQVWLHSLITACGQVHDLLSLNV